MVYLFTINVFLPNKHLSYNIQTTHFDLIDKKMRCTIYLYNTTFLQIVSDTKCNI